MEAKHYFFSRQTKTQKVADLIVYKDNKPVIVVEAKSTKESCKDNIMQTDFYAFVKALRYSLTINGERLILQESLAGNKKSSLWMKVLKCYIAIITKSLFLVLLKIAFYSYFNHL